MSSKKFTYDERCKIAIDIAEHIIKKNEKGEKVSTRSLTSEFGVSNSTISKLMNDYVKKLDAGKYEKVKAILQGNIPKTIENIDVKQRVLEAAKLVLLGLTTKEIADKLNVSEYIIQEDLQTRLKRLDSEIYEKVVFIHNQKRKDNLKQGNNTYMQQQRNNKGRFDNKK